MSEYDDETIKRQSTFDERLNKDIDGHKTTAESRGGVLTPASAPELSESANGNLVSGLYYVAFSWKTSNGETLISATQNISVSSSSGIYVQLPSYPENAQTAAIYLGTTVDDLWMQGETDSTVFEIVSHETQTLRPIDENNTHRWITPTVPVDNYGNNLFSDQKPGLVDFTRGAIKDYFDGEENKEATFNEEMTGFSIYNYGDARLTFTINGIAIPVEGLESFEGVFDPFVSVSVSVGSSVSGSSFFKAYVKK